VPTTDDYCQRLARKLGVLETGTTSITPDYVTDADAARVIVAADLYDTEGETDKFAHGFAYLPQSGQVARCHGNGYSRAEATLFTPPGAGTYTLTMHGYGATAAIAFGASAATVQAAIRLVAGFEDATVVASGSNLLIDLGTENPVDITPSTGTVVSRGLGRVKLSRPLSAVPAAGTAYELTGELPRTDYDGWRGLRSFVNDALAQTPFAYRVPLTATDARQAVFDLSAEVDWLKLRKQVIGLYSSGQYDWAASFAPPGSGTYTLSLRLGATTYTTASLAYTASAAAVQAALEAAIAGTGVSVAVAAGSPMTLAVALSRLYPIVLTASAGTVSGQSTTEITEPSFLGPGGAFAYRNGFPVFESDPFPSTTETLFLACHRRASTWIAPQTAWDTPAADSAFAASLVGLVGPSDRALPDEEQVANLAYAIVCEYLYDRTKDPEWSKKLTRVGQQALYASIFDTQTERNPGRAGGLGSFGGWSKLSSGGISYR
jgi:hypothetical protein